jgi:hypothetical protein
MREEWQTYWRQYRRYRQYVAWGLLLAMVPFAFNYAQAKDSSRFWPLLATAVGMSLVVSLTIAVFIGGFFAILTVVRIRTGLEIKRMPLIEFALISIGIVTGVILGRTVISFIRNVPVDIPALVPAIILSMIAGIGFALHIAYRNAKEDALAMRTMMAEARYNLLEQQMRPHFLFNSLNSLAEMIESGHERASDLTHSIAEIYRLILTNSREKTVPLEAELDVVRRYLDLERVRFGQRLEFSIDVQPSVGEVYVPGLVIQTLVENGIKHGIAKSVENGRVAVKVSRVDSKRCMVEVENSSPAKAVLGTAGTGLENTRSRLELLYEGMHEFQVAARDGSVVAHFYFSGEKIV